MLYAHERNVRVPCIDCTWYISITCTCLLRQICTMWKLMETRGTQVSRSFLSKLNNSYHTITATSSSNGEQLTQEGIQRCCWYIVAVNFECHDVAATRLATKIVSYCHWVPPVTRSMPPRSVTARRRLIILINVLLNVCTITKGRQCISAEHCIGQWRIIIIIIIQYTKGTTKATSVQSRREWDSIFPRFPATSCREESLSAFYSPCATTGSIFTTRINATNTSWISYCNIVGSMGCETSHVRRQSSLQGPIRHAEQRPDQCIWNIIDR